MVHFAITSGRPPTFKTNLWHLDPLCTKKQLGWLRYKQFPCESLGNTSQAVTPVCTFRNKWAHVTTRIVIILSFIIVFVSVSVSASALSTRTNRASLPFLPTPEDYGAQPRCKLWCNSWFHFHKPRNPIPETKRPHTHNHSTVFTITLPLKFSPSFTFSFSFSSLNLTREHQLTPRAN